MASRVRYEDKRSKERKKFGPILNIRFLLGWRLPSPGKNRDKQLTHIVRVKGRAALKVSSCESCYFELKIIPVQELVDFGALLKSKRSRDKIVKAEIN